MLVRAFRFGLYIWMRIFHGLQFSGTSNIPKEGPVIIAGNHPSYFDPVVLSLATTRHVRFFALADILKVPVIGWFARQWGIPPVYKGGNNEETIQKALRVLQRGGAIGIFPRGTPVAPVRDGLRPPGVGRLAVQSGAKVVPCVIYGTGRRGPTSPPFPTPRRSSSISAGRRDRPAGHVGEPRKRSRTRCGGDRGRAAQAPRPRSRRRLPRSPDY
jgi:1-acyl-sn-glycerol-3-phosphate acyltransferase